MAKVKAEILSPWEEYTDEAFPGSVIRRPLILRSYAIDRWSDVTGQSAANLLPAPNLVAMECECDEAVLARIDADPIYSILWSEPIQ